MDSRDRALGLAAQVLRAGVERKLFGAAVAPRVGRYRLLRKLGRDAEGTIFAAEDVQTGHGAVVKVGRDGLPRTLTLEPAEPRRDCYSLSTRRRR